MIKRKDSLCYIEFIRGKYNIKNFNYIQILINKFNNDEKKRILKYDYETLWKQLWLIDEIDSKYNDEFNNSKDKFNKLKEGIIDKNNNLINLNYFVQNSDTDYIESEWEFPKGRKNKGEKNKECAIREFLEETNYNSDDYEIIMNIKPFIEDYIGENKIRYTHIYYVALLKNNDKKLEINKKDMLQCLEVSDIKWLNKEECENKIRNYHLTRKKVIDNIFNFLKEIDNFNII